MKLWPNSSPDRATFVRQLRNFGETSSTGRYGDEGPAFLAAFGDEGKDFPPESWASCHAAPMIPSNTGAVR